MWIKKGHGSYISGYKYSHYQACLPSPLFGRQSYHSPSTTIYVQNTPAAAAAAASMAHKGTLSLGGTLTAHAYLYIIPITSTSSA